MNRTKSILTALAAAVFMMSAGLVAQGQNSRTWVSGLGSDGNSGTGCQQAAPCRTFATAIGVTNAAGQVVAVDNAGYAPFSINKAITIEGAPGVTAFIFVPPSTTGITVTGAATDLIVLRNIFVDGAGNPTTTGLNFTGQAKLVVQNCTFRSLTTGINAAGTNNTTLPARMDLVDSDLYSNGTGVLATGSGANSPGNPQTASTTIVRINGGNITVNGTGVNQVNPGSNLFSICLFSLGTGPRTNIIANTTNLTCSGAGCNAIPCVFAYNTMNFGP